MKAIGALVLQDLKRLLKNALFWVVSVTLVLIVLLVQFVFPKSVSMDAPLLVSFQAPSYSTMTRVVDSEAALRKVVAEEQAIGFLGDAEGNLTILHHGLSEKTIASVLLTLQHQQAPVRSKVLQPQEPIPFNLHWLPVLISFEALVLGFILSGTLMLSEKQEGTVRAMRISPLSEGRYIIAKMILFVFIGSSYAGLMALFTVGPWINWIAFLLVSALGSALFALIGLAVTTPFRDMNSWFFSTALLLSVNMLSALGYSNPSIQPWWMRMLPSYPFLMSYDDILFGSGWPQGVWLTIGLWMLVAIPVALLAVRRVFFAKGGVWA